MSRLLFCMATISFSLTRHFVTWLLLLVCENSGFALWWILSSFIVLRVKEVETLLCKFVWRSFLLLFMDFKFPTSLSLSSPFYFQVCWGLFGSRKNFKNFPFFFLGRKRERLEVP